MDDLLWPASTLPLTDDCHHYTERCDVPWDIQKYWSQRYHIYPNYDDGIYLTDDAWFGVTPQPIAQKIADNLAPPPGVSDDRAVLIDLFAGAGGNTVAFALSGRWARVIAIEQDAATLACAQNNAVVCGVPDGAITWVHADCFAVLDRLLGRQRRSALDPALRVDPAHAVIFASPPWGGISYRDQPVFDLSTMEPYNLETLHAACRPLPHALYLPRTSDLQQIADVARGDKAKRNKKGNSSEDEDDDDDNDQENDNGRYHKHIEVVQYCIRGASKALVAYYPAATATTTTSTSTTTNGTISNGTAAAACLRQTQEHGEGRDRRPGKRFKLR
ncbi:RNA methylase family [Niveomyces insectorum RCEF 264]|uniref:Trimethylguanosine synthase n=1 Tax=Niveomyces insectorum RCEF 264 TaxID=1081102 RepID=A0A162J1X6_9HYPO|nr:RNA methylase family [Niveomyces insectorum RCEF 264]